MSAEEARVAPIECRVPWKTGHDGYPKMKKIYKTKASAESAVRQKREPGLHAYECPHGCGGWHLGHKRRRKK